VVLHIEQFDYTFACFVWITCQDDIFVLNQNLVEGIIDLCGMGGECVQWQKRVTALHCNLFSRIKYYAYTKYIVLI